MKKSKNLFSILIVWVSTIFAGIINYFYHPVMIRYLDIKEFAEFESLLWIMNLLSVLVWAFSLFLVKEFMKLKSRHDEIVFLNISIKLWFLIWFFSFLSYMLFSVIIYNFLKLSNYYIVIIVWIIFAIINFWIYQWIIFQWYKKFKLISFFNFITPLLRLVFWFVLVFFWFKLYWAIWWFLLSQILLFFLWHYFVKDVFGNIGIPESKNLEIKNKIKKHFFKQKHQIFHFTLSSILLAVFMYIDILFAKHFFSAEVAWIYSWISVIAKFLVTIGMSIETVYYPSIVSENKIDKKKFSLLSLLYFLMTVWAIWFFYLFWEKILHLFKPWFEEYLNLLYLIIIYCWILSLLNFLVKILIAFEKYFINYIILAVTGIFIWILYLFVDNSVYNLINIFNLMIFVSLFAWFVYFFMIKDEK